MVLGAKEVKREPWAHISNVNRVFTARVSKYQRFKVLAAEPNWLENRLSLANVTTPDNVARKQRLRQSVPL